MTRVAKAFINFTLAIAAFIAFRADAAMAISDVFTCAAVLTQVCYFDTFLGCSIFT